MHTIADAKSLSDSDAKSESIAHRHRAISDSVRVPNGNRADELSVANAIGQNISIAITDADFRTELVSLGTSWPPDGGDGPNRDKWQSTS